MTAKSVGGNSPKRFRPSKRVSLRWAWNESDHRAIAQGYSFDEARAQAVVDWVESNCCLYQGVAPGTPMNLGDWQYEVTMRLFGWVKLSDEWGRYIRRIRRAGIWISKKSAKSPQLAAWGLFLCLGDGESGQNVYSAARDGKQAWISHRHAMEMVRFSPALSAVCSVNESTGRIFDRETRSSYQILAGDNYKSLEGLNGSVLIDETHVVDRRMANVLKYAGASRSEPMHIEVSTAGNDPQSYGKEQFDYGLRVESGELDAPDFFFKAYTAPQSTGPEDLEDRDNLIRLGKLANPTWGRIVRESEFLAAYDAAKDARSKVLDFLMYRLCVWQASSNPWLNVQAWDRCRQSFTEDDLAGQTCNAGLDMASVKDLNALSLCFPEPEGVFKFLWYFWLPTQAVKEYAHLAPFEQWAADPRCNLTLTEGSAVHHEVVVKKFAELAKKFRIRELVFDKSDAEWATRVMSEGMRDEQGRTILAGSDVPRLAFPQGLRVFNELTRQFEALVLSGQLQHNGDPFVAWQAGHAAIRSNRDGEIKPVKPDGPNGVKKIDALISAVMSLARAMAMGFDGGEYSHEPVCYSLPPNWAPAQPSTSPKLVEPSSSKLREWRDVPRDEPRRMVPLSEELRL
jgi:phage terminase large subunit-like protein